MRKILIALAALLLLFGIACAENSVKLTQYVIGQGYKAQLSGKIDAESTIQALVYNERTMKYDADITVKASEGVNGLNQLLLKKPMTIGEKQMIVLADGAEVYRAAFYVLGEPDDPTSRTKECELSANGDTSRLRDGSINSTLKIGKDGLKVKFPADFGSGLFVLEWRHPPKSATVHYYDLSFNEIGYSKLSTGFYTDCIPFGENVGGIFIETPDPDGSLADVFVYAQDAVPSTVKQWTDITDKLDILFVSTHQDDEFLFFGGGIPYFCHTDKNVGVAYTADCGIKRYYEAMSALWVSGLRNHPIFLGYSDFKPGSVGEAQRSWAKQGDVIGDLVEVIRKYQPDVLVTQDYKGEYGHLQHVYTVQVVTEAVKAAMDPEKYPESAQKYGAWEVKKFYSHLYTENVMHMNWDKLEVPGLGGISALDLAKVAYNRNQSQLKDFSMEKQGVKYDCTKFGLVYSAVGPDVDKNDFFENID